MMRTFELHRDEDETGISGTGVVAQGVVFEDGPVALRWIVGEHRSTVIWPSVQAVEAIHGHGGRTRIVWTETPGPPITCMTCGRGMWPGDDACCPLPKSGTHHWGESR